MSVTIDQVLSEHMNYLRVARRKGKRVRLQNIHTARMGGWITDPYAEQQAMRAAADKAEHERQRRFSEHAEQRERMSRLAVVHSEDTISAYTIAQIRTAGEKVLGITFPSKARKAEMVAAYMAEQTARLA